MCGCPALLRVRVLSFFASCGSYLYTLTDPFDLRVVLGTPPPAVAEPRITASRLCKAASAVRGSVTGKKQVGGRRRSARRAAGGAR